MANPLFDSIQVKRPNRNHFDLSSERTISSNMGLLVPVQCVEAVPGDDFTLQSNSFVRFAPMLAPCFTRVNVYTHTFFVPNRILWPGWEDFITQGIGVAPTITYTPTTYGGPLGKLIDYFGLPAPVVTGETVSALPFAAYQMIYNEYYRDQNLVEPVDFELSDGNNATIADGLFQIRNRAWEKDYFTSALPFAQKGPAVELPLGELVDVPVQINRDFPDGDGNTRATTPTSYGPTVPTPADISTGFTPTDADFVAENELYAQTSIADLEATTINDLRTAWSIQRWLELAARAGSRYVEQIWAFFGVKSDDARLNRPEYVCGTKTPVTVSEVLNTTGEDGGLPQGTMAGHGYSLTGGKPGRKFVKEHGFFITIMSVMPVPLYQQGIDRMWLRKDQYDYFFPQFAHLGEQEVKNKELDNQHAEPNGTFGYQSRYAEYKYSRSLVCGQMKTSLNFWHLGRIFATPPNLNEDFITCKVDETTRIFAVTSSTEDHLWISVLNRVSALRPMPKFGTPI